MIRKGGKTMDNKKEILAGYEMRSQGKQMLIEILHPKYTQRKEK